MTAFCRLAPSSNSVVVRFVSRVPSQWMPSMCVQSVWLRSLWLIWALWPGVASVVAAQGGDPPARVGHASVVGSSLEHSKDSQTWQPASVGEPLTTQSSLRTAQSRAEVRIGSTALRIPAQVQLQFEQLDDAGVVVALHTGRLNVRLRQCCQTGDRFAVLLDGARFDASSAGTYHFETNARALRATARVYAGSGTVTVGSQRIALTAGQQVLIDTHGMKLVRQGPAERNPIDDWSDEREQQALARAERGGSALYASTEMTGADLLDEHGAWRTDPRAGPIWFPRGVAADWAPFRQGRWAWVAPWGWTWIDSAPWGFAPFHYGRWTFLAGRWGWLPGNAQARPVYAPALVGFYGAPPGGWGPSANTNAASATGGAAAGAAVGWYPLGPGELYLPPGRPSPGYVQALNVSHMQCALDVSAPTALAAPASHRYAQTSFAATVVPLDVFESGQSVALARLEVTPGTLAAAPALGSGAAPARPRSAPRAALKSPR